MMTLSVNARVNIILCLFIVLAIGQVLTATALIILFKEYSNLKKKVSECQKNISRLIKAQTGEGTETGLGSKTATMESKTKEKWRTDGEESPTRVPTPPSNRRSSCKPQKSAQDYTFPRSESSSSHEMMGFPQSTSFTSARSRDSGTGSLTRTPKNSISMETKMLRQIPLSDRNSEEGDSRRVSRASQISQSRDATSEARRTSSTLSQGLEKKSFGFKKRICLPSENFRLVEQGKNQNELPESRSSRLQTMAIEKIGLEENNHGNERQQKEEEEEKSPARRSKVINENELLDRHSFRLQTMAIEMIGSDVDEDGLANEGYHDDKEEFTTRSKKQTLAGEELARDLKSENQQINGNFCTNLNDEKEKIRDKWHKDGEEMPIRVPTPPSDRRSKRNQNQPQDSFSLQTMAIGMIGSEEKVFSEGRKNERSSVQLNSRNKEVDEEPLYMNNVQLNTRF